MWSRIISVKFAGILALSFLFIFLPNDFIQTSLAAFIVAFIALRLYDDLKQSPREEGRNRLWDNLSVFAIVSLKIVAIILAHQSSDLLGTLFLIFFLVNHLLYIVFDSHPVAYHFLPFFKYPYFVMLLSVPDDTYYFRMALLPLLMLSFDAMEDPQFPLKKPAVEIMGVLITLLLWRISDNSLYSFLSLAPLLVAFVFRFNSHLPYVYVLTCVISYLIIISYGH